jgi:beta-aspartyl-peptidase (threonine type)
MLIVASSNARAAVAPAVECLRAGGSAVDAVELAVRLVEDNRDDHTVGYGGYPNLLGQVELDAAIMEGRGLAAGAVGAVQGYRHPISVARAVMERLPHVFLAGRGAERFAAELGMEREELLTEEARRIWAERLGQEMPAEEVDDLAEDPHLSRWLAMTIDPAKARGTVNVIALDAAGDVAVGVSTSGWAWKYPGRLGDSPVVGAGLYADNRYGAAACTGMGEMSIRAATAHTVVTNLRAGLSLLEAARAAMLDLDHLAGPYLSAMSLIAVDRQGNHVGLSNQLDRTYVYQRDDMEAPVEAPRTYVPTRQQWGQES